MLITSPGAASVGCFHCGDNKLFQKSRLTFVSCQRHASHAQSLQACPKPAKSVRSAPPSPRGSRPVSFRSLRRELWVPPGTCRPSSSPAQDLTCRTSPAASDQALEEELKLQGPGRPAPPAHGPGAAPSGGLLRVAGHDCSASRPSDSLARPILPPKSRLHRPRAALARAPR